MAKGFGIWMILLMGQFVFGFQPLPKRNLLDKPLTGFSKAELEPIWKLFQAYPEGRNLLLKARRKLRVAELSELATILRFCSQKDIGEWPDRRGLYRREVAQFYRERGDDGPWLEITKQGREKLENPKKYPRIAERRSTSEAYEQLQVAFQPSICLRSGLNHFQAFLVLVHEFTHLIGLPFFEEVDLLALAKRDDRMAYHYEQIARDGGEVEAYIAQIKAFQWIREAFEVKGGWSLESFLGERGQLLSKNRKEFMDHLLFDADYFSEQEFQLDGEVYHQYNRAYSWWEFLGKVIEAYDQQRESLEKGMSAAREMKSKLAGSERPRQEREVDLHLKQLRDALSVNQAKRAKLNKERNGYREFLDAIDRDFPNAQ